jgi:AhpD family alkylhydroperoxidase
VGLRLAQLHGSPVGLDSHTNALRKRGEKEERLKELHDWSSSLLFNRHERFVLALAENLTSNPDAPVTKALLEDGPRYFSRDEIIRLTLVIQTIDDWNATDSESIRPAEESKAGSTHHYLTAAS